MAVSGQLMIGKWKYYPDIHFTIFCKNPAAVDAKIQKA